MSMRKLRRKPEKTRGKETRRPSVSLGLFFMEAPLRVPDFAVR